MEKQPEKQFIIEEMQPEDIEEATAMRHESWLDTYVNDELGVTREWIKARNAIQSSPEKALSRLERFTAGKANGKLMAWVARNHDGAIVGSTTPYLDDDGVQHVGSLYVDKTWHGKGVGGALMQKVIDWADSTKPIELGVVAYNKRAIAFYRKWGFEQIPDSEKLFDNKIPEVMMIRKAQL